MSKIDEIFLKNAVPYLTLAFSWFIIAQFIPYTYFFFVPWIVSTFKVKLNNIFILYFFSLWQGGGTIDVFRINFAAAHYLFIPPYDVEVS